MSEADVPEPKHSTRVFRHRAWIFALGAALAFPLGMVATAVRDGGENEGQVNRPTTPPVNRTNPAPIASPESVETVVQSGSRAKLNTGDKRGYEARPSEPSQKRSEAERLAVDRLVLTQRENVEESRVRMLNLMNRYKIVDLTDSREPLSELAELESMAAELEGLEGNDLIEKIRRLKLEDQSISRLYPALQKKQADLAALLDMGLGEKHPEVIRLRLRSQHTLEVLDRAAANTRRALETRVKIAMNRAGKVGEQQPESANEVAETADEIDDERRKHIEFMEVKADYEAQKMLLTQLREKLVKKPIDPRGQ